MDEYFTEREYGRRPAGEDTIGQRLWDGLRALVELRLSDDSFGARFPAQCPDGNTPCGCDSRAFQRILLAEVPWIEWPLKEEPPDAPVVLDLLEFCARAVGQPSSTGYHSYYGHYHRAWDRAEGLRTFVADVNMLMRRNGAAFELDGSGRGRRKLPPVVAQAVGWTEFSTGDDVVDGLLEGAKTRFLSADPHDRVDAIEKLWDAFERIKTLEPGDSKRVQADALLDCTSAPGTNLRQVLGDEATALTAIGNTFRIRHSERGQEELTSTHQADWLFTRMFAFLNLVLRSSGRGG